MLTKTENIPDELKAGKYPVSNRWFISESEIRRLRNEQQSGE